MIYVEEKGFSRQFELLEFLSENESLNLCGWLYPESKAPKIAGYSVSENTELEAVTAYENGFKPFHTEVAQANQESINRFKSSEPEVKSNLDSIALYKSGSAFWVACTIGHEGMCLVRDTEMLANLTKAGFNASNEAPSWW